MTTPPRVSAPQQSVRHLSLEEKQRKAETEIARLDAQPRKPVDSEWLKKQYLRGNKTAAYVEGYA